MELSSRTEDSLEIYTKVVKSLDCVVHLFKATKEMLSKSEDVTIPETLKHATVSESGVIFVLKDDDIVCLTMLEVWALPELYDQVKQALIESFDDIDPKYTEYDDNCMWVLNNA